MKQVTVTSTNRSCWHTCSPSYAPCVRGHLNVRIVVHMTTLYAHAR